MPSHSPNLNFLDRSISKIRGAWVFFYRYILLPCFIEVPFLNANSVDPDQMQYSVVSDLGLHCLPASHLWDTWLLYLSDLPQI